LTAALPPDMLEMTKIHQEMLNLQTTTNDELDQCQREGVN
jgi:hypothetical protein